MIKKYKNLGTKLSQKEMKEIKGGLLQQPPNGRKYECPLFISACIQNTDTDCFLDCPSVPCFTSVHCF